MAAAAALVPLTLLLLLFQVAGVLLVAAGRNDMTLDAGLAETNAGGTVEPSIRLFVTTLPVVIVGVAALVCLLRVGRVRQHNVRAGGERMRLRRGVHAALWWRWIMAQCTYC